MKKLLILFMIIPFVGLSQDSSLFKFSDQSIFKPDSSYGLLYITDTSSIFRKKITTEVYMLCTNTKNGRRSYSYWEKGYQIYDQWNQKIWYTDKKKRPMKNYIIIWQVRPI